MTISSIYGSSSSSGTVTPSILSTTLDSNGHLIIVYANGARVDVGNVVGVVGAVGPQGIQGQKGSQGDRFKIDLQGSGIPQADASTTQDFTYLNNLDGKLYIYDKSNSKWNSYLWVGSKGEKGDKGDTGTQGSGFVVDYKGPGITPRAAYNSSPAGTSYLDTTYGMLYFRQTDTIGQWGPAIPISGTGGNLSSVDFVSHGSITDPADSSQTIPAHNVLRIKSVSDASPTDSGKTWSLTGVSAPAKLKQIYARGDTTWEAVRPKMSRISDVTAPPTATQFNQLLAELRNKGYME